MAGASGSQDKIFTGRFFAGFVVNFLLYVDYYALMVAMAGYSVASFSAGASEAGFSASIFIIGALVARVLGANAIDKIGRGVVLMSCLVGMLVCSALYFVHPAMGGLLAIRFLHGGCYGVAQTTVTSIVSEGIPFSRKGEGVGYYMLSVTLGAALGPFLGSAFSTTGDFNTLFAACTAIVVVGLVGGVVVARPKRSAKGDSAGSAAKASSANGDGAAVASADSDAAAASSDADSPSTSDIHAEADAREREHLLHHRRHHPDARPHLPHPHLSDFVEVSTLPVGLAIAVMYLSYGAVITYLNSYAAEVGLTKAASLFFVAYSIAMFVARPLTGRLFDSSGDLGIMTAGFAALAGSMALLGVASNDAMLYASAALAGFGVGAVQPNGLVLAMRRAADERLTAANSTYFVMLDVAIGLCPIAFGWIAPAFGYRTLFWLMVPVVVVSYIMYLAFRRAGLIVRKKDERGKA